jgi:hypothetical protein
MRLIANSMRAHFLALQLTVACFDLAVHLLSHVGNVSQFRGVFLHIFAFKVQAMIATSNMLDAQHTCYLGVQGSAIGHLSYCKV